MRKGTREMEPQILREFESLLGRKFPDRAALLDESCDRTILMNPTRLKLFTFLCFYPCSNFNRLCGELGLKPPNALWHLRRLNGNRFIEKRNIGRKTAYMPAGMVAADDVGLFALLNSTGNNVRDVVSLLQESPGCCATDVSLRLGCSFQTALRVLQRMKKAGMIRSMRDGRFKRYYIAKRLLGRHGFYRKREKSFRSSLLQKIRVDGLAPEIVRIHGGRMALRLASGREKDVVTFNLNPMEPALRG